MEICRQIQNTILLPGTRGLVRVREEAQSSVVCTLFEYRRLEAISFGVWAANVSVGRIVSKATFRVFGERFSRCMCVVVVADFA